MPVLKEAVIQKRKLFSKKGGRFRKKEDVLQKGKLVYRCKQLYDCGHLMYDSEHPNTIKRKSIIGLTTRNLQ